MIYRDGFSGFVDYYGSCGLIGRLVAFLSSNLAGRGVICAAGGRYAFIAAISGAMAMMLMTRFRL